MAINIYNGIEVKCPTCGTVQQGEWYKKTGLFDLSMHIVYSNAHGCSIRLFCGTCTDVHECTVLYKEPENVKIEMCSWKCSPTPTPEQIVAEYGQFVAIRENLAHGKYETFKAYDDMCQWRWKLLKKLGCYVDREGSELKPEYREIYYTAFEKHYRDKFTKTTFC